MFTLIQISFNCPPRLLKSNFNFRYYFDVRQSTKNLDRISRGGISWVGFSKYTYFLNSVDNFGELVPPNRLINNFHKGSWLTRKIVCKYVWCGHLLLRFRLHQQQQFN